LTARAMVLAFFSSANVFNWLYVFWGRIINARSMWVQSQQVSVSMLEPEGGWLEVGMEKSTYYKKVFSICLSDTHLSSSLKHCWSNWSVTSPRPPHVCIALSWPCRDLNTL
jgi:hypothetical protein